MNANLSRYRIAKNLNLEGLKCVGLNSMTSYTNYLGTEDEMLMIATDRLSNQIELVNKWTHQNLMADSNCENCHEESRKN